MREMVTPIAIYPAASACAISVWQGTAVAARQGRLDGEFGAVSIGFLDAPRL
jgi:hypothetical protein